MLREVLFYYQSADSAETRQHLHERRAKSTKLLELMQLAGTVDRDLETNLKEFML